MSTTSFMTFAEFERLPSMPGKQELIDGILVTMPPPERTHQEIAKRVFFLLLVTIERKREWPDGAGYRMGAAPIEPDVSVTGPHQEYDDKYFVRAPQLAVEVLALAKQSRASCNCTSLKVVKRFGSSPRRL